MGFRSPVIVWDFVTGDAVAKYDAHKVRVESVAFSFCETYLMSLGGLDDGTVLVYDIVRGQVLCSSSSVKPNAGVAAVIRPTRLRGQCFVVAGDNLLRLWTLNREQRNVTGLDATLAKIKRNILCVEIDRKDKYAYCGTSTGDLLKIKLNLRSSRADSAAAADNDPITPPALVGCFGKYPTKTRDNVELYSKGVTSLHLVDDADGAMIVGSGNGVVELVGQKPSKQSLPMDKKSKPVDRQSKPAEKNARRPCAVTAVQSAGRLITPTHPLLVVRKSTNVESTVTSIQMMKKKVSRY